MRSQLLVNNGNRGCWGDPKYSIDVTVNVYTETFYKSYMLHILVMANYAIAQNSIASLNAPTKKINRVEKEERYAEEARNSSRYLGKDGRKLILILDHFMKKCNLQYEQQIYI